MEDGQVSMTILNMFEIIQGIVQGTIRSRNLTGRYWKRERGRATHKDSKRVLKQVLTFPRFRFSILRLGSTMLDPIPVLAPLVGTSKRNKVPAGSTCRCENERCLDDFTKMPGRDKFGSR